MKPSFLCQFFWASKWWFFRSPLTEMTPYTPGAGFGELFADSSCMENLESTWFPTALLMVLCFCFVYLEPKWPWYWVQRAFFWTPKMEDKWVPGKCWLNKHYCAWLVDMSTDLGGCMRVRLKLGGSSNQWNASRYAGRFFRRATKNSLPIMINVMKQWLNFIYCWWFYPIPGFVNCERELLFSKSANPGSATKPTNQLSNWPMT